MRKHVITFENGITLFRAKYKSIKNYNVLQPKFTVLLNFRMLSSAVLMNIPNFKVRLKGKLAISIGNFMAGEVLMKNRMSLWQNIIITLVGSTSSIYFTKHKFDFSLILFKNKCDFLYILFY